MPCSIQPGVSPRVPDQSRRSSPTTECRCGARGGYCWPTRPRPRRSRSTPTTARTPLPQRPAAAERWRGANHRYLHPPLPHVTQPHSRRPPLVTQQAALVRSLTGILPPPFPDLPSVRFPLESVPCAARNPSVCPPFPKTALLTGAVVSQAANSGQRTRSQLTEHKGISQRWVRSCRTWWLPGGAQRIIVCLVRKEWSSGELCADFI